MVVFAAGFVITGAVVSTTLTVSVAEAGFPEESVVLYIQSYEPRVSVSTEPLPSMVLSGS